MAITLKEVAERAGVSRSAVSRTFTPGASVSERTREKVLTAADALGYRPNALASSLTTGRTKLVGLVSNNFHNPMFLQVFDLFTRALQEQGLRPLLVNLSDETDPLTSVRMMLSYSVDGVIVASSTLPPSFAKAFREAGIPVVHSFGRFEVEPSAHVVGIDNIECGRMAARRLIGCGYTRIAFLGGPENATSTQDRHKGFMEVARAAKGVQVSATYARAYSFDAGREAMAQALGRDRAQGYFCGDDVTAIGAISAVESAGLRVPEDVGIIGLNDMEMARWASVNLTTIHQPIDQIITASVDRVIEMLEDPQAPPLAQQFSCRVVERGTLPPIG